MGKIVLRNFRRHVVDQLVESITEPANNVYYLVASRSTEYDGGDDQVPSPTESVKDVEIDPYQEIIFGKKITSNDVAYMIDRYTWTSNTVYARYNHTDTDLLTKQYYVVHKNGAVYNVYKCLDNNFGGTSTAAPTDTDTSADSFITVDGYKWKFLYQVPEATFEKFATSNHMPVYTNTAVSAAAVDGAITVVGITSNGSNYISSLDGTFSSADIRVSNNTTYRLSSQGSSNADFYTGSVIITVAGTGAGQYRTLVDYTTDRIAVIDSAFTVTPDATTQYIIRPKVVITGDGTGALAYATVNTASGTLYPINSVVMVNVGSNYSYATAVVAGNTGSVNAASNAAVLIPFISPSGGHGTNPAKELGCKRIGLSVKYNTDESGYLPVVNDYRKIQILKDPLFDNVQISLTDEKGSTASDEIIYQFKYSRLHGEVSVTTSSNSFSNSAGVSTDFSNSVRVGDYIYIYDTTNNVQRIKQVSFVNSSVIQISSNVGFACTNAKFALATITAQAVRTGYSGGVLYVTDATPKFTTGELIIGEETGATGLITAINVGEPTKSYNNWNTFDNRTRIYISNLSGTFANDEPIYQSTTNANGFMHSANSTLVCLTQVNGTFNSGSIYTLTGQDSGATANILSSYTSDIVTGTGDLLYAEHGDPITRNGSQSETIRLVLEF